LPGLSVSGTTGAAFSPSKSRGIVAQRRIQPRGKTIACKGGLLMECEESVNVLLIWNIGPPNRWLKLRSCQGGNSMRKQASKPAKEGMRCCLSLAGATFLRSGFLCHHVLRRSSLVSPGHHVICAATS
jgi:hypothetical protein